MDSPSDYGRSPPISESPSSEISAVIQQVEELQKSDQLKKLEKLTRENVVLQQQIIHYQKAWCAALNVRAKAHEAIQMLHASRESFAKREAIAERNWLAFWGIGTGPPGPGSWI
jgi:hypothetical protein